MKVASLTVRIARRGAVLLFALVATSIAASVAIAGPSAPAPVSAAASAGECPALLDRSFKRLQDESDQSLCQYRGKVILVVNTASYCGYTSQYQGLEALYARYQQKGLVVLGFPSNDFEQEPDDDKKVADFCYNTYGVKFPMFSKSSVVGPQANSLYLELADATGKRPGWNFFKYMIDRKGKVVASFPSAVTPSDPKFLAEIKKLLAQS